MEDFKSRIKLGFFVAAVLLMMFCALLWALPPVAQAAPWSGILDPSRAIDWSQAGVTAGIPDRTTICATLNPGATAAQINSAIANCPSGQVVKLNAGTYNLISGISMKSNVTLRGSGADVTKLNFSGLSGGIGGGGTFAIGLEGDYSAAWWDQVPGPSGANPSNIKTWIGTNGQSGVYTKGATVLNLGSAPTFAQTNYHDLVANYNLTSSNPDWRWDAAAHKPYLSINNSGAATDQFVTFEDPQSLTDKVNYVTSNNLGGWIIWALDQDYFPNGVTIAQKYPLSNAIALATSGNPNSSPSPPRNLRAR